MRRFFCIVAFVLLATAQAFASSSLSFITSDGQSIAANFYANKNSSRIILVAPGFAQSKNTKMMSALCHSLAADSNVLCFDFRGTGNSTGTYVFGAKEYLDFEPILKWSATRFKTVNIIGLSLGAYSAVRAAYEWPEYVTKLLLVSCPTSIEDIISTGGLFSEAYNFFTHPNSAELKTGASWIFHWGSLFDPKPNLKDIAPMVQVPAAFLVGSADRLVANDLSREVYDRMSGSKSWDVLQGGDHAEAMFVQAPKEFLRWVYQERAL